MSDEYIKTANKALEIYCQDTPYEANYFCVSHKEGYNGYVLAVKHKEAGKCIVFHCECVQPIAILRMNVDVAIAEMGIDDWGPEAA